MLTIYRASAGSGKTHRLTGDYLELLFSHRYAYRHILAVTFTNKATDEMKKRIMEELYHLATGRHSDHNKDLCQKLNYNKEQLQREAHEILVALLHDYSSFHVTTIDRFFQQIMRAFTREIGLQGGYGIEMDQEMVLTEAVDNMLLTLDDKENEILLQWLLRFSEEKIEGGGEWNLRRDIMTLGREIFKENFKAFNDHVSEDIADKQELENYKKELYQLIRRVESQAKQLGEDGLALISRYGLEATDFKGGSRSAMLYFQRLADGEMKEPTATFRGFIDNPEGCYSKTAPAEKVIPIRHVFEDGLNALIQSVVTFFDHLTDYYTAKEIIRYYYTLGILNDLSLAVANYREEKNVMLIADTTELLHKVIDGSDAPFIYEKTGTRIDHYMIDEFQDTSRMQWDNFHPLLRESLAYHRSNLIVGDVKQSIYRFRNSDWELLDQHIGREFAAEDLIEKTLKDNWRSKSTIIDFNNSLFVVAPRLLQAMYNRQLEGSSLSDEIQAQYSKRIVSAYRKSVQSKPNASSREEGHVRVEFIDQKEDERGWKECALERLPSLLEQLQENGYPLRDIAILTRTNYEGSMVAEKLLTYQEEHPSTGYRYDIISDDALFVNNASSVRFIIALLRHLYHPGDIFHKQLFRYSWYVLTGQFSSLGEEEEKDVFDFPTEWRQLSFYEMIEAFYAYYSTAFPENEQIFLQAFLDIVADFTRRESHDIGLFLKWWEETGSRKTIDSPEGQDAIRILTIHKAKGLGVKAVIVPFCDWEIDHKSSKSIILWCQPHQKPFNRLRMVPVRYNSHLAETHFAADYFNEKLYTYTDNINTLYVALTRAKEELIVLSPRPKKIHQETGEAEKVDSVSQLLWTSLVASEKEMVDGEELQALSFSFDLEEGIYEAGNWVITEAKKPLATDVVGGKVYSVLPGERLRLRLYGKGFFFDNERRKYGALMHEILSHITSCRDIPKAVERFRLDGVIDGESAAEICRNLETLLQKPEVKEWYGEDVHVWNEAEILSPSGKSWRPDRVVFSGDDVLVIDYKFGEQKSEQHRKQVRNYIHLIKDMGYLRVRGYLWYIEQDETEEVY